MKTNAEMLKTIIEYAVERGWKHVCTSVHLYGHENEWNEDICEYMVTLNENVVIDYRAILFSHPFAKAVFGEKRTCFICGSTTPEVNETYTSNGHDRDVNCSGCGADWMDKNEFSDEGNTLYAWQYELQQCVISPDPILYYYNFVTERREG